MLKSITTLFLLISLTGCQSTFLKSSETQEDDLLTLRQEAAAAYSKQDYQAALPMFQQLNEAVPNDAQLWLRTGNIHARLNQPTQAIDSYEKAVRSNPQLSTAWHNMAVLQLRQAANTLTQMVRHTKPDDPLYPRAVKLSEATLNILGSRREKNAE